MATVQNRKGEAFISPLPHPAATAVDVKSVDWNRWKQVYILTLKKFIMQLLYKFQAYKFHEVFIAPWQPTAPWFPVLHQRSKDHLHLHTQLEQLVQSERVLLRVTETRNTGPRSVFKTHLFSYQGVLK